MRHFCYFRGFFFGKDLPLFLTKKISKKQNCGLPKFLLISFKNELLLKKFSDSKSMTLLDIETYHYDIFVTNTIDIMKDLKTYKISPFFFFFFQNITFHGVICRFQRFWLNMKITFSKFTFFTLCFKARNWKKSKKKEGKRHFFFKFTKFYNFILHLI